MTLQTRNQRTMFNENGKRKQVEYYFLLAVVFGVLMTKPCLSFSAMLHCRTTITARTTRISPTQLRQSLVESSQRWGINKNDIDVQQPQFVKPSELFQKLALSQLELLANSLTTPGQAQTSKIRSMGLYLPQENTRTGQLEFRPLVIYPHPSSERVFIASKAGSGVAPTLPKTLTKLPGFSHASTLLPAYPMINSSGEENSGIGAVEEVFCNPRSKDSPAALSVPLISGSQTVGVLLVSPGDGSKDSPNRWTESDKQQISIAARSLSMALSMDTERSELKMRNEQFKDDLLDSLHQVKNPLQALRVYSKLLQRHIARAEDTSSKNENGGATLQIFELVELLTVQSDRVMDMLVPVDTLVNALDNPTSIYTLGPGTSNTDQTGIILWDKQSSSSPPQPSSSLSSSILPWESETLQFARDSWNDTFDASGALQYNGNSINTRSNSLTSSSSTKNILDISQSTTAIATTASAKSNSKPSSFTMDDEMEMAFISDLLEPIFTTYKAIATERGVLLDIYIDDELPGVMVAPNSLQEAITNVIENAFKYVFLPKTNTSLDFNNYPFVRIRVVPNEEPLEAGVTIYIEDNGPGIAMADRMAIFDRGFRSERTNTLAGTGLGLHICQSLLHRMGGTIEVVKPSTIHKTLDGAVFKISLFRRPKL